MKTTLLTLLSLLAAAPAVLAAPYAVRQLPAGVDVPVLPGSPVEPGGRTMPPMAADFLGNGRLQWYFGGNQISRFPDAGTITLPAITLPQTLEATIVPLAAAVCDADRDGDMDIVRINEWNGNAFIYTLQVFRNNGFGTFTVGYRVDWIDNHPTWNEGAHFLSIVPGDFNKDGAADLAILENYAKANTTTDPDREEGKLYIRWNDRAGGFGTSTMVQPNGLPSSCTISAADYDRDGDPDLYCRDHLTYGPDPINIFSNPDQFWRSLLFRNDGTGAFGEAGLFQNVMPQWMMDINNDGWADFVGETSNTNIVRTQMALNNQDGTFAGRTDWIYSSRASAQTFADYDKDGETDLITGGDQQLRVMQLSSVYSDTGFTVLASLPSWADRIGVADSDADGDMDFMVTMGNGGLAFVENRELQQVPGAELAGSATLGGVTSLRAADFDLDGREDILAVSPGQEKLWFIPTGNEGLPGTPAFRFTQSEAAHSAVVADFDQNGRPDVAFTIPALGAVQLAMNTGNSPILWPEVSVATGLPGVSMLTCGTFGIPNGTPDLFACSGTTGQIRALYQSGGSWSGTNLLSPYNPAPLALAAGQGASTAGDELAFVTTGSGNLRLRAAQQIIGWNEIGSGVTEPVTGGPHAAKVIWANIMGDSRNKEVVYINRSGSLAAWQPLTNTTIVLGSASAAIRDIVVVDWDRDGRDDVLAATGDGLSLFHFQRATQTWVRDDLYTPNTGSGCSTVTTLDLNKDGWPDAVAETNGTRLDYLLNEPIIMKADFSTVPVEAAADAGTTATVITVPLRTAGRPAQNGGLADVSAAVNQCTLEFRTAVSGPGGVWTPGVPISSIIGLRQYITSAEIVANTETLAQVDPAAVSQDGTLTFQAVRGNLAPMAPGAAVTHSIRLTIAADAGMASPSRFFVSVKSIEAEPYDGGLMLNLPNPARMINNRPVLVTIQSNLPPLQQWRQTNFGVTTSTGTAANDADPDGDGVPNLVEYFTGTNPKAAEQALNTSVALSLLPITSRQQPVNLRLTASTTALADPKVRVTIQSAASNLGTWSPFATRTGGGAWTGVVPTVQPPAGGRSIINFASSIIPAVTPKFFVRLKVEELP